MSISTEYEKKILDKVLRGEDFDPPPTPYIAVHTADPEDTGEYEVTGGLYARQAGVFAPADDDGRTTNTNLVVIPIPDDDPEGVRVTHASVWSAVSGGSMVWSGPLDTPGGVLILPGSSLTFFEGELVIGLD